MHSSSSTVPPWFCLFRHISLTAADLSDLSGNALSTDIKVATRCSKRRRRVMQHAFVALLAALPVS